MSQHPVRFLVCDKPLCTTRFVHTSWTTARLVPLSTLRTAAKQQGWKRTTGRRDYCPSHNPWPGFAAWATATPSRRHRMSTAVTDLVTRQRLAAGLAAEARHQMDPAEGPIDTAFAQMACDHPEACSCPDGGLR